jgi:hypothetical protein
MRKESPQYSRDNNLGAQRQRRPDFGKKEEYHVVTP